jgi:hypothetical protein
VPHQKPLNKVSRNSGARHTSWLHVQSFLYDHAVDFERCRRGEGDFSHRMFNAVAFELWAGMESRHLAP